MTYIGLVNTCVWEVVMPLCHQQNKAENFTKVKVDRPEPALCISSQINLVKLGRLLSQIKIPV